MIEIAFFGQAFADAELKEGRRGKYVAISASTDNAGDEDDESQPSWSCGLSCPAS